MIRRHITINGKNIEYKKGKRKYTLHDLQCFLNEHLEDDIITYKDGKYKLKGYKLDNRLQRYITDIKLLKK